MAHTCCIAGMDDAVAPMFSVILKDAGACGVATTLAHVSVREVGRIAPDVLVCDVDSTVLDPLELLRQIRFILPECLIAVYTGLIEREWSRACHFAGVNCLLAKDSNQQLLAVGLRSALLTGCYTAPGFFTDRCYNGSAVLPSSEPG